VYVVGYVCTDSSIVTGDFLAPDCLADDVLANDISRFNGTQSFVPTFFRDTAREQSPYKSHLFYMLD
jgi:hypothetical protein